jgi:4-hydroxy-tetrahydrodipicolinate synthase
MKASYSRRDCLKLLGTTMAASRFGLTPVPASAQAGRPGSPEAMRGIFIILSTPYTEAKAVDYDDLAAEVEWLHEAGIHGYVWPQNSSDYRLLTKDEIMRGMEVLAKAVKGKEGALVLGVQQGDTRGMLELAAHAEKLNPDAFIAMPPRSAKSVGDYREYYGELGRATARPVILQTVPNPPGVEFSTDLVLELAARHPHLGYVKEEEQPVFDRIQALVAKRPPLHRVYGAIRGRAWPYELRLGTDGTITGAAMYADAFVRSWAAYLRGDWNEVRDIHAKVLLMLMCEDAIPGTGRYLLKRRGIFKSTMARQRNATLSRVQIDEIEHNLRALQPYLRRPLPPPTI